MVEINLLPWRVYSREYNKKRIIHRTITLLVFSLIVFLILYSGLTIRLHTKNKRVLHLQRQLTVLQKKPIQEQRLETTSIFNWVTTFQRNQARFSLFLNRLVQLTPEGMTWQTMAVQKGQMFLTGNVTSFPLLMEFLKLFDNNQDGFRIDILKMKHDPHSDLLQFSLRCSGAVLPLSNLIEKQHG